MVYRNLGPQPRIKPVPSAVESRSPNHWTAKEVLFFFKDLFLQMTCYRKVGYITWSKVSDWDLCLGFRNLRMKTPRLLQPPCTLGNRPGEAVLTISSEKAETWLVFYHAESPAPNPPRVLAHSGCLVNVYWILTYKQGCLCEVISCSTHEITFQRD